MEFSLPSAYTHPLKKNNWELCEPVSLSIYLSVDHTIPHWNQRKAEIWRANITMVTCTKPLDLISKNQL